MEASRGRRRTNLTHMHRHWPLAGYRRRRMEEKVVDSQKRCSVLSFNHVEGIDQMKTRKDSRWSTPTSGRVG